MRRTRRYYELQASQVRTPAEIVSFYWKVLRRHRQRLASVLDLGAGDARFAKDGRFERYVGVEIDEATARTAILPMNGELRVGCAFAMEDSGFSACIGNPPYVRHHDLESPWKERTARRLAASLNTALDAHGNLFLYFICLGLLKTHPRGLVALIVPFEWLSKPSAKGIRDVLHREGWGVTVYRFEHPIFEGVLTTASISVIDKATTTGEWRYFNVTKELDIKPRAGVTGSGEGLLEHKGRAAVYAQRGLSPGSQSVFTLTEGERRHHGLTLDDVRPCVTTLRGISRTMQFLSWPAFQKHFVRGGRRCWLIKSNQPRISKRLREYLANVPLDRRDTYTCANQTPWYKYETAVVPNLLLHSGFTKFGPKVLINSIGAVNVGAVFGVHMSPRPPLRALQRYLVNYDFEQRTVAHAKTLKKIEVRQVNAVLEAWWLGAVV